MDDIALNVKLLIVTAKIEEQQCNGIHIDREFLETKCVHGPLATPVQMHTKRLIHVVTLPQDLVQSERHVLSEMA